VAVIVVHLLEMVEVDEQDGQGPRRAAAAQERVLEALEEQDPVRQAGEGIVHRALVKAGGRVL